MDSLAILPHEDKRDRSNSALDTPLGEDVDGSKLGSKDDVQQDEKADPSATGWTVPEEWIARFIDEYTGEHGGQSETLPPGSDPELTARAVMTFHEDEAKKLLEERVNASHYDYNFDTKMMERLKMLIQGPEACGYEHGDWAYITSKTAGYIHNWSPYAEVRAVTIPYDDPNEPCESFRAYFLGFFWVIVVTAVNTCESSKGRRAQEGHVLTVSVFSPRQPGISIPGSVVQLLLVPMGRGLSYILPDWGFTRKGVRYTINPGPWTSKEQLLG